MAMACHFTIGKNPILTLGLCCGWQGFDLANHHVTLSVKHIRIVPQFSHFVNQFLLGHELNIMAELQQPRQEFDWVNLPFAIYASR